MDTQNVPLIIPNFNQLFYLKNLIAWWQWYYPQHPIYVLDNKSTYKPLLDYYKGPLPKNVSIIKFDRNNCGENLKLFLDGTIHPKYKNYAISNPDVMPHPGTPENFLEVMLYALNTVRVLYKGRSIPVKKVGFGLIVNDLPDYIDNKEQVIADQADFWKFSILFDYQGKRYTGHRAPIDLTFAVYSTAKGGWVPKMALKDINDWQASLRVFNAFHLGWYIEPRTKNIETINYFMTAKAKCKGDHNRQKGVNTYRPKTFM